MILKQKIQICFISFLKLHRTFTTLEYGAYCKIRNMLSGGKILVQRYEDLKEGEEQQKNVY